MVEFSGRSAFIGPVLLIAIYVYIYIYIYIYIYMCVCVCVCVCDRYIWLGMTLFLPAESKI